MVWGRFRVRREGVEWEPWEFRLDGPPLCRQRNPGVERRVANSRSVTHLKCVIYKVMYQFSSGP